MGEENGRVMPCSTFGLWEFLEGKRDCDELQQSERASWGRCQEQGLEDCGGSKVGREEGRYFPGMEGGGGAGRDGRSKKCEVENRVGWVGSITFRKDLGCPLAATMSGTP